MQFVFVTVYKCWRPWRVLLVILWLWTQLWSVWYQWRGATWGFYRRYYKSKLLFRIWHLQHILSYLLSIFADRIICKANYLYNVYWKVILLDFCPKWQQVMPVKVKFGVEIKWLLCLKLMLAGESMWPIKAPLC